MEVELPHVPFGDEPVEEIILADAPLVSVVSQVRFPEIASIEKPEFIGSFQEAIRDVYPVARREHAVQALLTPKGVADGADASTVWRFADRADEWQVALAPGFVALSTNKYVDHDDFLSRLSTILEAAAETIKPILYERVGIRYVDLVPLDGGTTALRDLVRPEVTGLSAIELGASAAIEYSLSDTMIQVGESRLHGRWGLLPKGAAIESLGIGTTDENSWILDLDMFDDASGDFDVELILRKMRGYIDQIYRFFRWAVTGDFLERFGART